MKLNEDYQIMQHQSIMNALIESEEMNLVKTLQPKIFIDGNSWCVLYGENIQDGVCGFGETPRKAIYDFNKSWDKPLKLTDANELRNTIYTKKLSTRILKDNKYQVIDQNENVYFQGSEIDCINWIKLQC